MQRMTQFKDKSSEHNSSVTMGLMSYPVLMAADILLYNAKYIPVGEDQFQHLEITRDIAERFNNKFGEVFVVPEDTRQQTVFIQRDTGLRVRSLSDPTRKMSKSSLDEKSKINLNDSPDIAVKKLASATTDSVGVIHFDWDRQPGVTNLLQILSLLSGRPQADVNEDWVGKERYGDLKKAVAVHVHDFLVEFQQKYSTISDADVLEVLERSEAAMSPIAEATLLRAQQAVGLRPRSW